jgi:hypothetical protein
VIVANFDLFGVVRPLVILVEPLVQLAADVLGVCIGRYTCKCKSTRVNEGLVRKRVSDRASSMAMQQNWLWYGKGCGATE